MEKALEEMRGFRGHEESPSFAASPLGTREFQQDPPSSMAVTGEQEGGVGQGVLQFPP